MAWTGNIWNTVLSTISLNTLRPHTPNNWWQAESTISIKFLMILSGQQSWWTPTLATGWETRVLTTASSSRECTGLDYACKQVQLHMRSWLDHTPRWWSVVKYPNMKSTHGGFDVLAGGDEKQIINFACPNENQPRPVGKGVNLTAESGHTPRWNHGIQHTIMQTLKSHTLLILVTVPCFRPPDLILDDCD
jgi:hypothetical protein